MFSELLHRLVNDNAAIGDAAFPDDLLKSTKKLYGLSHIAYMGVNLPAVTNENYFVHNTYSDSWSSHYETQNYINIDPITSLGFNNLMPIDWGSLTDLTKQQKQFFGEAREFGVGNQGLSFSIRGNLGEIAIFAINSHDNDVEWQKKRAHHMREFRLIADYFHQQILTSIGNSSKELTPLTSRETEILKWCSTGKTYWEISQILAIKESTVAFHIANTISKLNCYNKTHATVKAIRLGII